MSILQDVMDASYYADPCRYSTGRGVRAGQRTSLYIAIFSLYRTDGYSRWHYYVASYVVSRFIDGKDWLQKALKKRNEVAVSKEVSK